MSHGSTGELPQTTSAPIASSDLLLVAYRVAGHADLLVAAHVGSPADVALATAGVAEARLSVERAEHAVALLQRLVRRAKNRGVQASVSHTAVPPASGLASRTRAVAL